MNGLLLLVGLLCTDSPLLEEFLKKAATPTPIPVVLVRVKGTDIIPAGAIDTSDPEIPKGTKGPIPAKDLHLPFEAEFLVDWRNRRCRRTTTQSLFNISRLEATPQTRIDFFDGSAVWHDSRQGALAKHQPRRAASLFHWQDYPVLLALGLRKYHEFRLNEEDTGAFRRDRLLEYSEEGGRYLVLNLLGSTTLTTRTKLDRQLDYAPIQIVSSLEGKRLSTLDIEWAREKGRFLPVRWRQTQTWRDRIIGIHHRELVSFEEMPPQQVAAFQPADLESRSIEDCTTGGEMVIIEPSAVPPYVRILVGLVMAAIIVVIGVWCYLHSRNRNWRVAT